MRHGRWALFLALTAASCAPAPRPTAARPAPNGVVTKKQTPDEALKEAEAELRSAKVPFDRRAPFDFYLYFPTEPAARKAESDLKAQGYRTEVRASEPSSDWACVAGKELEPGSPAFREAFETTISVAEKHGGLFDGWELAMR